MKKFKKGKKFIRKIKVKTQKNKRGRKNIEKWALIVKTKAKRDDRVT